jgi:spermidine synthase
MMYLIEQLTADWGFYLRVAQRLASLRSDYQHIEVFESPLVGRLLRIDGCFMTSERDEFFYHENLVHVAAVSHPRPESALVIGGGDGGAAEELLKHKTIGRVVLAELDEAVTQIAREWLGSIHRGAFDDPRFELKIGDGKAFVESGAEKFDLILLDLTDPFGPAQGLYTAEFYRACKNALNPGGAIACHLGAPLHRPGAMARIVKSLQAAFTIVRPYLVYVPLYGTWWGMACASDTVDPMALDEAAVEARIRDRGLTHLQFYNGATHRAVMALPNFVKDILARPVAPIAPGDALEDVIDPASLPELQIGLK